MRDIGKLPGMWTLLKGVMNNLAVVLGELASVLATIKALKQGELVKQADMLGNGLDLRSLFARKPQLPEQTEQEDDSP